MGEAGRTGEGGSGAMDRTQGRGEGSGGKSISSALDHTRLIRELGNKYAQSTQQLLQQYQGVEFDQAYIGMQIGMHTKVIDTLEVFKNYASQELQSTFDQGLQVTRDHLQSAKQLMEQLEQAGSKSGR